MKKKLIKPISFDHMTFEIGDVFYEINKVWFIKTHSGNVIVPSYIDMNSDYFEDVIERKFKIGDCVLWGNDNVAFIYDFYETNEYELNTLGISSYRAIKAENDIKLVDKYYFIDASGNIQKTTVDKSKKSIIFKFKTNNIFIDKEEATQELNKIMSR